MQKRNWFRLKHRMNNFNNPNVTTQEFVGWKRKILQQVENKIISLKHPIKADETNPVSKQDIVIEYLMN